MALLIPFAAPLQAMARVRSDQVRGGGVDDVLPPLPPLPNLAALIAQSTPVERDDGDEWSLTPPHERALARALGWSGSDGQLPFAARAARADGLDSGDVAVGLVTPSHWHLGTDQVSLVDPAALVLAEDESHALFDAVLPTFTSEGFGFAYGAADRWYLLHESLAELATASLDRVIGRNVDRWLGSQPAARRLRRLQSEVQMLLYEHPVNAAREARGARVIVIDRVPSRLEMAKAFGADHVINFDEVPELAARVALVQKLAGAEGVDVAVEVTGVPAAFSEGINYLRTEGVYVTMGNITQNSLTPFDPALVVRKSARIIGVGRYPPKYLHQAVQFLAGAGQRYPFDKLVDRTFSLDEVKLAIDLSAKREVQRAAILPTA